MFSKRVFVPLWVSSSYSIWNKSLSAASDLVPFAPQSKLWRWAEVAFCPQCCKSIRCCNLIHSLLILALRSSAIATFGRWSIAWFVFVIRRSHCVSGVLVWKASITEMLGWIRWKNKWRKRFRHPKTTRSCTPMDVLLSRCIEWKSFQTSVL